jgi:hypothetical protein
LSSEEWKFEFIILLNGYPLGIQRLPDKFGEFVVGNESRPRCSCWRLATAFADG